MEEWVDDLVVLVLRTWEDEGTGGCGLLCAVREAWAGCREMVSGLPYVKDGVRSTEDCALATCACVDATTRRAVRLGLSRTTGCW